MRRQVDTMGVAMDQNLDAVPWKRYRYVITFLIFFAIVASFTMRTALSIAVVAMTDNSTNPDFETFDWSLSTRGTILSSFFWGYVVTNVPCAIILQKYGPRWILLVAIFLCSIATLVMPIASSEGGWIALCILRVIQGVTQGAVFPSMNNLLAKWSPPNERGLLGTISFSGMQAGNIIVFPVSGALASGSGGWPSIFYVFAAIGIVWCVLWFALGYDTPGDHPYISENERKYIESFHKDVSAPPSFRVPVKDIALSLPVWSLIISHGVQCWGYYMLLNEMPTYMNNILNYDIKANGILSSLPYVVMLILIFACAYGFNYLTRRKLLTLNACRKVFNTVGFMGPLLAMIGLVYVPIEQKEVAVTLFVIAVGLNSGVYVGFQINHVDLSPNFAGILMGLTNGLANTVSLFVTIIVGVIVTDEHDRQQWNTVFWITAGIYLLGTFVYLIFGANTIQPWNEPKSKGNLENPAPEVIKESI